MYKYGKKIDGQGQVIFTEDGHTMFDLDLVKNLNRKSYLEKQLAEEKKKVKALEGGISGGDKLLCRDLDSLKGTDDNNLLGFCTGLKRGRKILMDILTPTTPAATECAHDWVDASNEVVSGADFCTKCKGVRATPDAKEN